MNHCDEILLDRLVNGSLDLQKNISCRIHLLFCHDCQSELKRVRDDRKFLDELRRGVLVMERAHAMAASLQDTETKTDKTDNTNHRYPGGLV